MTQTTKHQESLHDDRTCKENAENYAQTTSNALESAI